MAAITGTSAQFGRGVMQDVSDKPLGQFVACLEDRLTGADVPPVEDQAAPPPSSEVASHPAPTADPTPPPTSRAPRAEPEALDLGAAALPVLARLYWKPVLGALVASQSFGASFGVFFGAERRNGCALETV